MSDLNMIKLDCLQALKRETSPAKLEAALNAGVGLLADIQKAFADASTVPEIAKWCKSIQDLQAQSCKQRTVVGVVGSTGAGKSSVINAVLNQESLVPTNGMRACTATITEIQYNDADDSQESFRGEVHFVTEDDWMKELHILLDDLQAPGDNRSGDSSTGAEFFGSESAAAVAYDKIRCVYPHLLRDDILKRKFTPQGLAQDPSVSGVLGTVKEVRAWTIKEFNEQLQVYIDSKEKTKGRQKDSDRTTEFWPLIKVVRLFVKSKVLEPGLVLVDLPGIHDSNAARSTIASKYIEECTGLWIIAPITRAVDDKAAQTLLGSSFRRQLQFDGTYSALTVVCSKSDDVSVTEFLRTMPESHKVHSDFATLQVLQGNEEQLKQELLPIKNLLDNIRASLKICEDSMEFLETAMESAEDDQVFVKTRLSVASKRKPKDTDFDARKRSKQDQQWREESDFGDDSDNDLDDAEYAEDTEIISMEAAELRLKTLKAKKKALKEQGSDLERRAKGVRKQLRETRHECEHMKALIKSACIQFRNNYSRPVIQQQFAEGIRELDQENAAMQDEENFDPSFEARDYTEVAARLPVFCVSSRAYLKMAGMLKKDEPTTGFLSIGETQIPALQEHAMNIVAETQAAGCRQFLTDLSSFIISLIVQIIIAEKPLKLADDMKEKELAFLKEALAKLTKKLHSKVDESFDGFEKAIKSYIVDKFESSARIATDRATETAKTWGQLRDQDGRRGLVFLTYRATCLRDGVFKAARGPLDWNQELCDPIEKRIAPNWEHVFSRTLPRGIKQLGKELAKSLEDFEGRMHERQQLRDSPSYDLVRNQTKTVAENLKDTISLRGKTSLKTGQKNAIRLLKPAVADMMRGQYQACSQESGLGSYKRMKDSMEEFIQTVAQHMFKAATDLVGDRIHKTLEEIRSDVDEQVNSVVARVDDDYKSLVLDRNLFKALESSRRVIKEILETADNRFKAATQDPQSDNNQAIEPYRGRLPDADPSTPSRRSRMADMMHQSPFSPTTPAQQNSPSGLTFSGGVSRLTLASPAASVDAASTPIKKERE
ncbi:Dynamin family-domain-containing protein [Neurospora hispaniola]|uniref:Dynamin family-domain-containing protein n=1 Tax=Neurospora hispaniola TaxID=588809 RepID=A0AAJ0IAS3_9PEZI|nr:Dynamin family-domain-containing protein [Neurospora hispaniola]